MAQMVVLAEVQEPHLDQILALVIQVVIHHQKETLVDKIVVPQAVAVVEQEQQEVLVFLQLAVQVEQGILTIRRGEQ